LAEAFFEAPLRHADRGFGGERVGGLAEEQEIGRFDFHGVLLHVTANDRAD
jgi:hypothetical protein